MYDAVLNQIWCTGDQGVKVIILSFHFELSEPQRECLRVIFQLEMRLTWIFFYNNKYKFCKNLLLFFRPCWRHFSLFVELHSLPLTGS